MAKLFYLATAVAFSLVPFAADAADLPVKAKSLTAYPVAGSGFYWGVNAEAGAAQSDVSGNALFATSLVRGNLIASGGSMGGTIGYLKGDLTNWLAIQASVNYTNISGSVALTNQNGDLLGTTGVRQKWSAEQVVKWGGFGALMGFLPNIGVQFPVLTAPPVQPPPGFVFGMAKPYMMAGVREFDNSAWISGVSGRSIGVAPLVGMGMINPLIDSTGVASGAVLDTYAKVIFPGRGFSIDFDNNAKLNGAANMGTQYVAGIAVYY